MMNPNSNRPYSYQPTRTDILELAMEHDARAEIWIERGIVDADKYPHWQIEAQMHRDTAIMLRKLMTNV